MWVGAGALACIAALLGGCGSGSGSANSQGLASASVVGPNNQTVKATSQSGTVPSGSQTAPTVTASAIPATVTAGQSLSINVAVPQAVDSLFVGVQGAGTYFEADFTQKSVSRRPAGATRASAVYEVSVMFGAQTPAENVTLQISTETSGYTTAIATLSVAISSSATTGTGTTANLRAMNLEACGTGSAVQLALGTSAGVVSWPSVGSSLANGAAATGYVTESPSSGESEYALASGVQVATATNALTGGGYYTAVVYGDCSPPAGSVGQGPAIAQFQDSDPTAPPANEAAILVVNLAPSTNAAFAQYDIYSNGAALSGLTGVAYGAASSGGAYTNVTAGAPLNLQLYAHAAGGSGALAPLQTTAASQLYSFSPAAGAVYTLFIYGNPDNNSLNVTWAQGRVASSGSTTSGNASVRGIDLELCSATSSAQVALGSLTNIVNWPSIGSTLSYESPPSGYVTESPSSSEAEYALVGGSQVAATTTALSGGGFYTIAVYGECSPPSGSTGLGPSIAQFADSYPASLPANVAGLRVINLAPSTNASYAVFDIYSNGAALPGLTGVTYGAASSGGSYTNVTANGTTLALQLYAHAAGSTTEALAPLPSASVAQLEDFAPTAGYVYTIFIYGSPDNGSLNASWVQDVR
jgi:hypothetical protein